MRTFHGAAVLVIVVVASASPAPAQRQMEALGRGVVAIRQGGDKGGVFVAWRLLGGDDQGISFNVYRGEGGAARKLNDQPISNVTFFVDQAAPTGEQLVYSVRPLVAGKEGEPSPGFVLTAN